MKPLFLESAILLELYLLFQQYFDIMDYVHFMANKVTYVLDWDHIGGHGRSLKCVNRLLLPEFSCNVSSVWSGVIIHKGRPVTVGQWMTIIMVYNVCVNHVVVVTHSG